MGQWKGRWAFFRRFDNRACRNHIFKISKKHHSDTLICHNNSNDKLITNPYFHYSNIRPLNFSILWTHRIVTSSVLLFVIFPISTQSKFNISLLVAINTNESLSTRVIDRDRWKSLSTLQINGTDSLNGVTKYYGIHYLLVRLFAVLVLFGKPLLSVILWKWWKLSFFRNINDDQI